MSMLKRHLSVANVLSCIALFVALGGVAYAAVKIPPNAVKARNIARQAVTNPKIKREAVTSGKIRNGSVNAVDLGAGQVTGEKLGTGAVTGKKIAKKAVSERTIANEAVTIAKLGKEAVDASKISTSLWEQLVRNVAYESASSASDSEPNKTATANCPKGKEAVGGGVRLEGELAEVAVTGSYPLSTGNSRTGWVALAHETGPGEAGNWSVVAFVVCAEL
ncbi:MAG TPA: hypothetical protein VGW80_00125 [Solirubrobacterales bacterium]|nr:hypothetical protein [Solirubrobacterales bacterium]